MATDAQPSPYKPLSHLRLATNHDGQVEVTLSGHGGHFLLSANDEGPYVVMASRRGNLGVETVGFFYLTADGQFRGSWHEKDPEHPRKELRLKEKQSKPIKKRRKNA